MEFIIHRVNLIEELKTVPAELGCEIDIRTDGSNLILSHDPFSSGDKLTDYLDEYKNGTLVLNIKESGIEDTVLKEVRIRGIKSYFLLDVEFPYLYNATNLGERNIASRFSEKEPIENLIKFQSKVDWVWIDTISSVPVDHKNKAILELFKSCLVCPSRWGRGKEIYKVRNYLRSIEFKPDKIMTDFNYLNKWR